MGKEEFIKEAENIGYSQAMIDEILTLYEKAKREGIEIPLETHLIELPK